MLPIWTEAGSGKTRKQAEAACASQKTGVIVFPATPHTPPCDSKAMTPGRDRTGSTHAIGIALTLIPIALACWTPTRVLSQQTSDPPSQVTHPILGEGRRTMTAE